ncbi:MAG: response regulator [Candidatus Obscuribacterales bacterium]|nr:response regulator [Candidatus Obscuribacterales bacterium]
MADEKANSVLIVDDDAKFRQLVCELLKHSGYRTLEARSAKEGTAILASENPGLLIVDYRLPVSDGLSWIGEVRDSGRNMPAVLISGTWLDKRTFDIARNIYRVSLILRKPIAPRLFLSQLRSLLPTLDTTPRIESKVITAPPAASDISIPGLSPSAQAALERVRKAYLAELPQSWRELRAAIKASRANSNDTELFAQAMQFAHRLRGSAGSLELNIIGQLSGKIEDSLDWIKGEPSDSQTFWEKIEDSLNEGEKYISEGLFAASGTADTPIETAAQQEPAEETLSSKVLFVDTGRESDQSEVKSYWHGFVQVTRSNSLKDQELNLLAQGSLDAAILKVSSKEQLFNLSRSIRSLPRSKSLPLSYFANGASEITPADLIYAGVSQTIEADDDETVEKLVEHLLALSRRRKPRIMSIEDEPTVSKVIGTYLANEGMFVYAVDEPIGTMNSLDEVRPDLILLDVYMNGLSGYDVCRAIRQSEKWHWLPILFLTAAHDAESRALAFEAGADDFLTKPIVPQELVKRVWHHIENPKRQITHKQRDAWTGMLEPRSLVQHLEVALNEAVSSGQSVGFTQIQMTDLNAYVLKYGFETAFSALNLMADLIRTRFPSETIRGSWGEFGFAVAIPGVDSEDMNQALKLLLQEYKKLAAGLPECHFSLKQAAYPNDGKTIQEIFAATK